MDTGHGGQKSDHLSMYNGQVWFESGPNGRQNGAAGPDGSLAIPMSASYSERRVSSAPSNSLDSALHAAINNGGSGRLSASLMPIHSPRRPVAGQFFPNAQAYVDNLASLGQAPSGQAAGGDGLPGGKRSRRRKVAPMQLEGEENKAFERGPESERHKNRQKHHRKSAIEQSTIASATSSTRSCSSAGSTRSSGSSAGSGTRHSIGRRDSVILESDQELLGFDSTGTPIIATHTSARRQPEGDDSLGRLPVFKAPAGATSYIVPLAGATVMTHEEMEKANSKTVEEKMQPEAGGPQRKAIIGAPKGAKMDAESKRIIEDNLKGELKSDRSERDEREETEAKNSIASERRHSKSDNKGASEAEQRDEQVIEKTNVQANSLIGELEQRLESVAGDYPTLRRQSPDVRGDADTKRQELAAKNCVDPTRGERTEVDEQTQRDVVQLSDPTKSPRSEDKQQQQALSWRQKQSLMQQRTMSEDSTLSLKSMQNRELLEKQSIFAMTYSGIATDKLPM